MWFITHNYCWSQYQVLARYLLQYDCSKRFLPDNNNFLTKTRADIFTVTVSVKDVVLQFLWTNHLLFRTNLKPIYIVVWLAKLFKSCLNSDKANVQTLRTMSWTSHQLGKVCQWFPLLISPKTQDQRMQCHWMRLRPCIESGLKEWMWEFPCKIERM